MFSSEELKETLTYRLAASFRADTHVQLLTVCQCMLHALPFLELEVSSLFKKLSRFVLIYELMTKTDFMM